MSDARSRYERWTKEQLLEYAVATNRGRNEDQLHRAAIKRDADRNARLKASSIDYIDRALRDPRQPNDQSTLLSDLIHIICDVLEAGDPLSSAPVENTMRVTYPTSRLSGDGKTTAEGSPTRRYRRMQDSLRYHLRRTTETIHNNLDRDPELSAVRREAAFYRHHKDGKHEGEPREGCVDCESEAS